MLSGAEQGVVEAQRQVGDLYHAGHGVAADDALAAAWYEKAAQQESAGAATKLCRLNETRAAGAE